MINTALSHTLPHVGMKSDGRILVLTDSDADCDEVTRTDIDIASLTKEEKEDNWCDGLTIFALFLTFAGFMGMIAQDVGEKAAATHQARMRLDQNCLLTYK